MLCKRYGYGEFVLTFVLAAGGWRWNCFTSFFFLFFFFHFGSVVSGDDGGLWKWVKGE